jgi:hypothetical protein
MPIENSLKALTLQDTFRCQQLNAPKMQIHLCLTRQISAEQSCRLVRANTGQASIEGNHRACMGCQTGKLYKELFPQAVIMIEETYKRKVGFNRMPKNRTFSVNRMKVLHMRNKKGETCPHGADSCMGHCPACHIYERHIQDIAMNFSKGVSAYEVGAAN